MSVSKQLPATDGGHTYRARIYIFATSSRCRQMLLITLTVKAWRIVIRRHVAPFQDTRFLVAGEGAVSRAVRRTYMPGDKAFEAGSNRVRRLMGWTALRLGGPEACRNHRGQDGSREAAGVARGELASRSDAAESREN